MPLVLCDDSETYVMKKYQSGFTLIEIAIVLVIIGLLLGGVLKGQEMINNSKIRNSITSMDGIAAAIYSYQDRYKALPGDDINADARWNLGGAGAADGDGVVEGAWTSTDGTADESALLWEHLRQAGLITGSPAAALGAITPPTHSLNGVFGVETAGDATASGDTGITAGTMVCMSNVEAKFGEILDRNLDDGDGTLGDFQNENVAGGGGGDAIYDVPNGDVYTVCRKI